MVLKLFGSIDSANTTRVMVCMEEIGLKYELIPIDLKAGEHQRPPHTDRNPFGQIPTLQDGNLVICESRVINRYLVRKFGKRTELLKEKSFDDSVVVDQWMEVEVQHFNAPISTIVFQHVLLPCLFGGQTDPNLVLLDVDKLGKILDVYEARLSETKFLAGDFYSLADLHHLPYGHHLINDTPYGSLINSRPHVKAWWDAIKSRPASKMVLATMLSKQQGS